MPTAAAFLIALLSALALTPLARRLALRAGVLDHALSSRKVHGQPIPRLGGVAIVAAFFAAVGALALGSDEVRALLLAEGTRSGALLAGGLVIAGLGLYDDLRGAGAGVKLAVEAAVAAGLYAAGWRIDAVALPLLPPLELGWLSLPVTVLWVAGVTNAVNLIDGLDGLAGGVAALAALALGALAGLGGSPLAALLAVALAGAALGFLRMNLHPATIFMGDTGSLFLGFVLSALALGARHEPSGAVTLLSGALVLGVPLADTTLAIGRRALRGAPLFRADRGHLHHRLLAAGLGHRGAVAALHGCAAALAAAALALAAGGAAVDALVLAVLLVGGAAALRALGLHHAPVAALLAERRRNLVRRAELRAACAEVRRAADWSELWPPVRAAAERLGADGVALRIAAARPGAAEATFSAGEAGGEARRVAAPLAAGGRGGDLELWWRGPEAPHRDLEIAVEILGGAVAGALGRIQRGRLGATPALAARRAAPVRVPR